MINIFSSQVIVLFATVILLAVIIILAIIVTKRRNSGLNVEKFRSEWMKINNSLDSSNIMTYQMGILNADKLLDKALKDIGIPGNTMGDRLKVSKSRFSNINQVWSVHKLRNHIAHDTNVKLNIVTAKKAIFIYKKSLKELGAI